MVARKTSNDPTRIWSSHALAPENAALARELLFRGNRYYNTLVEIARHRFDAYREVQAKHVPALAEAQKGFARIEEDIEEIYKKIKASRAKVFRKAQKDGKEKKTRDVPPELQAQLDKVDSWRKALGERYHELVDNTFKPLVEPGREEYKRRSAAKAGDGGPRVKERTNAETRAEMWTEDWPAAWKDLSKLDAEHEIRVKRARAACDLPSGCYLLIEKSVEQATKKSLEETGRPPRFRRFTGEGRIGVQVKKETFEGLLAGTSSTLRFRRVPARLSKGGGGERERAQLGRHANEFFIASLFVGFKRQPAWLDFSVRLDRQPPPGTEVKWAWLRVHRQGGERLRYELQLTLQGQGLAKRGPRIPQTPHFRKLAAELGSSGEGCVSVKFCSQSAPSGIRVATWAAETGETGEVVLPQDIAERLDYPTVLRSHADTHYDKVRRVLSLYCRMAGSTKLQLLESNSEARRIQLRNLCDAWATYVYGERRLSVLWQEWKIQRISSDKDLFAHPSDVTRWIGKKGAKTSGERLAFWCFLWARKDKHLRVWAGQQRDRAEKQRDAVYRDAAIVLSQRFENLVLDGTRLDRQKKRPKTEKESNEMQRMRTVRQNAAPGRCRELFKEVAGPKAKIERPGDEETLGGAREETFGEDSGTSETVPECIAAE